MGRCRRNASSPWSRQRRVRCKESRTPGLRNSRAFLTARRLPVKSLHASSEASVVGAPPEFAQAGVAGLMDLAASLEWVRDNVERFGGDPGKVMIRPIGRRLEDWVAFAKTGDPNNSKIPNWPAYETGKRATTIFDSDVHVENDPRAEIRKFWDQTPAAGGRRG
jgi:Carboxylesterase family